MKVRPFALSDLKAAARFCETARTRDELIEPFGDGLAALAHGARARLSVWRVLDAGDGELRGIAFAAAREAAIFDVYAAVDPELRRRGFGRALLEPALRLEARLRARVSDEAAAGRGFLSALGFAERSAQLSLRLTQPVSRQPQACGFRVRLANREDERALRRLSNEAWAGAPDIFAARPDDEVFAAGRTLWLAERDGEPAGYIATTRLGVAVAIEELAVLPATRRLGIARALVLHALQGARGAVLSVAEDNLAARALYESLGFAVCARRLVYQRKPLGAVDEKKQL